MYDFDFVFLVINNKTNNAHVHKDDGVAQHSYTKSTHFEPLLNVPEDSCFHHTIDITAYIGIAMVASHTLGNSVYAFCFKSIRLLMSLYCGARDK